MENARMTQVLVDMKNNVAIDAKTMNEFCKEGQKRAGYYYRKYSLDKIWDLEEFWNEVFIELYENKDKFDDKKAGFSTWFAFKCTHIAVRQLKKEDTRLKYFPLEDAYLLDDEGGEVSVLDCISDVNLQLIRELCGVRAVRARVQKNILITCWMNWRIHPQEK